MKKSIIALAIATFAFGACTPTTNPVTVSLSKTTASEIGLTTSTKQVSLTVTNSSTQNATINWERTETTPVTGWTYMVNSGSADNGTLSIAAGASATVTLTIDPHGFAGTGAGTLKFYDSADQNATMKTFTYSYSSLTSYFTLSPVGSMTRTVKANDPSEDYHVWVINNNTVPVPLVWRSIANASNPSSWVVTICTDTYCAPPHILSNVFTVAPGDSVDFKATMDHATTMGAGGTTALFFVAADSAASVVSQTVSHTAN